MPLKRLTQLGVPVGIVFIVVMLVVPLPAIVLDLLIALNIVGALLILLTAMFVHRPLDFAAFPAVILVMTLFRLALNVSATRLVLLDGYAGKVIDTFGHFVVGGSLIVGLVVFAILLVIQFVVITNGAGRVAEVGARFTLDAMPGKQMAIDADLNSGLIDEDEARKRRARGARRGRLLRRDGRCLEVRQGRRDRRDHHHAGQPDRRLRGRRRPERHVLRRRASTPTACSRVGDGLVSQIPALLLSVATGLIVTRSTRRRRHGLRHRAPAHAPARCRCGSPASAALAPVPDPRPAEAAVHHRRRR